jgi:hypothetical protein
MLLMRGLLQLLVCPKTTRKMRESASRQLFQKPRFSTDHFDRQRPVVLSCSYPRRSVEIPRMTTELKSELSEFHQFVAEHVASGVVVSPEEILEEFRMFHPTPTQHDANVAAVKAALEDMKNGDRGRPAADVLREVRNELGLAREQ